jgi:hypothetical protein
MVVVPLHKPANDLRVEPRAAQTESLNWAGYAAGGALIAGGLLLLTGQRRAGMVAATAGTALALLDQQETVRSWWQAIPYYIDEVEWTLSRVQETVNDIAIKREAVRRILAR